MFKDLARQELLAKYDADEHGLWAIKGADRNYDWCGARQIPDMGTVEGRYGDVVEWAINQPKFWNGYGASGTIEKVTVQKI